MELVANVEGVDRLQRVFNNLPRAMQRKAYRKALREGAKPIREAAIVNLKSISQPFTGLAQRRSSIVIYNAKKYKGSFRTVVQVRKGLVNTVKKDKDGNPVRVGMYLAVMEYGSQKLNRAPRPWIRKAIREKKNDAVAGVIKEMNKGVDLAVRDAVREAGGI